MMSKARIIDIIKSVVIAVLSISSLYLLLLAMDASPAVLIKNLTGANENTVAASGTQGVYGVITSSPYVIVLTDEYGTHSAAKYDWQAKKRVFSQFSVTLGEAIGSASNAAQTTEQEWREALTSVGVFFDYLYPQPLGLIAAQLGVRMTTDTPDITVRRLCLAPSGKFLCLYYIDAATGDYYRLDTALESDSYSLNLPDIDLPNASFAFKSDDELADELAQYDPYFVFSGENLSINAAQSASPLLSAGEGGVSLKDFSMSESAVGNDYADSDGTVVYVEVNKSLRISPKGTVLFTATGSDGIPVGVSYDTPTLSDCVSSAASLISATISPFAGDAEIGLISIEEGTGSGSYTLKFGYYVNGIPVLVGSTGWCAKIKISGGSIVRAELIYREYSIQSALIPETPEKYAAILSLNHEGSPLLFYVDPLGALLTSWY